MANTHKPLALRCQTPTDFIASLIEHHRSSGSSPAPTTDTHKTLLVFIGLAGEDGVFALMDEDEDEEEEDEEEEDEEEEDDQEQRLPGEVEEEEEEAETHSSPAGTGPPPSSSPLSSPPPVEDDGDELLALHGSETAAYSPFHTSDVAAAAANPPSSPPSPSPSPSPSTTSSGDDDDTYPTPTLSVLSAAAHIDILHLPDLRTLLTLLTHLQHPATPTPIPCAPSTATPLLAIWNLTAAHHASASASALSLSQTLSLAADAAADSGRALVLGEGHVAGVNWMDAVVPVLPGAGAGAAAAAVAVREVLGRWCRFAEDL